MYLFFIIVRVSLGNHNASHSCKSSHIESSHILTTKKLPEDTLPYGVESSNKVVRFSRNDPEIVPFD